MTYSVVKRGDWSELFLTTSVPDMKSEDASILESNSLLEVASSDSGLWIVVELSLFETEGY